MMQVKNSVKSFTDKNLTQESFNNSPHIPVMLNEVIEGLNIQKDGTYLDGTAGFLGHGAEIINRLSDKGLMILLDRDSEAISFIKKRIDELKNNNKNFPKTLIIQDNFKNIKEILEKEKIGSLDGVVLDLGVSSLQLDDEKRGFSYSRDCSLDMRMNQNEGITAEDIVNDYEEEELVNIFFKYGEEKFSKRIANNIIKEREEKRISRSNELVRIIEESIPKKFREKGFKNAKRIFQSLRIEVNNELDELEKAIEDIVELLKKEGRLLVITFNSLEDRIVKKTFKRLEDPCTCPKGIECVCGKVPVIKRVNRKALRVSEAEEKNNMRAKPAKLRIVEKL